MKRIHFKSLAIILALTAFLGSITSQAFAKSYRIGLSLPLSGASAKLAEQFLTGAKFAIKLHNESHPIAIELFSVDDGCSKELAKLATSELLAIDPPISIATGFLCNEAAYIAADEFKAIPLPILIAGAQSNRLIKDREREDWKLWRMSPGDQDLAKKAAELLSKRWLGRPYAIIDDGTVFGRTLADEFRGAMEAFGNPPQFNDNFRPTQSTQARLVRRLQKSGVTNVFVGADAEDISMIAKNAQELGIPLEIAGSNVLSILPFLPQDNRPAINSTAPLLGVLDKSVVTNPFTQELALQLLESGIEPEAYIYKGFAAMQVAINAVGDQPQDTISNLSLKTFDTIFGPISFSPTGENNLSPYLLYQWNGASFEEVIN